MWKVVCLTAAKFKPLVLSKSGEDQQQFNRPTNVNTETEEPPGLAAVT
jgi:hypothetical protein